MSIMKRVAAVIQPLGPAMSRQRNSDAVPCTIKERTVSDNRTSTLPGPRQGRLRPIVRLGETSRALGLLLAILVALGSYRYVLDLPPVPDVIAANRYRPFWLVFHAGFASTALLVGAVQFSRAVRKRMPQAHRWTGRMYVASCLIGAVSGLVLAVGASGGWVATAGFGCLALAWIAATAIGWQRAVSRQFASHRRWMIRSWALTLAAVTLRIYIPLSELADFPELPAYRAISFLCWMPNLMVAETMLLHEHWQRRQLPPP